MIPVGAGDIPLNGADLATRIMNTLGGMLQGSGGRRPDVNCEMATPEQIDQLAIDVTQVECASAKVQRPQEFTVLGTANIGSFAIKGDPALVFGAPVVVHTEGKNIPMAWSRDDHGNLWLVPQRSSAGAAGNASGHVELAAEVAQIERATRVAIGALAEQNGAKLKDLRLKIDPAGARGVAVRADVAASKFMMTAKVALTAEASVDDNMNLRIGRLSVNGDGAAGSMVANMLADKVRQLEGQQIDLGQFVFAGAKLEDVDLTVTDRVKLTARFGGGG